MNDLLTSCLVQELQRQNKFQNDSTASQHNECLPGKLHSSDEQPVLALRSSLLTPTPYQCTQQYKTIQVKKWTWMSKVFQRHNQSSIPGTKVHEQYDLTLKSTSFCVNPLHGTYRELLELVLSQVK